jgi:hypothetical protein
MEFGDFGKAAVNAIKKNYFLKLFVKMRITISFTGV